MSDEQPMAPRQQQPAHHQRPKHQAHQKPPREAQDVIDDSKASAMALKHEADREYMLALTRRALAQAKLQVCDLEFIGTSLGRRMIGPHAAAQMLMECGAYLLPKQQDDLMKKMETADVQEAP